jgi:hypothetical protein
MFNPSDQSLARQEGRRNQVVEVDISVSKLVKSEARATLLLIVDICYKIGQPI